MIGLMVVMLMVFFTCDKLVLVLWGVGAILKNGCGIWGLNWSKISHLCRVIAHLLLLLQHLFLR